MEFVCEETMCGIDTSDGVNSAGPTNQPPYQVEFWQILGWHLTVGTNLGLKPPRGSLMLECL